MIFKRQIFTSVKLTEAGTFPYTVSVWIRAENHTSVVYIYIFTDVNIVSSLQEGEAVYSVELS